MQSDIGGRAHELMVGASWTRLMERGERVERNKREVSTHFARPKAISNMCSIG
jgi:hypothetical protein